MNVYTSDEKKIERERQDKRRFRIITIISLLGMFIITLFVLLPWSGLDSLLYYTYLWYFEPFEVPKFWFVFALFILFAVSPIIFPWTYYADTSGPRKRMRIRLRKPFYSRKKGIRIYIPLSSGYLIVTHRDRVYKCGFALFIIGKYSLYYDGKKIAAEDPDKMELMVDTRKDKTIEQLEEEAVLLKATIRQYIRMFNIRSITSKEEFKTEKVEGKNNG